MGVAGAPKGKFMGVLTNLEEPAKTEPNTNPLSYDLIFFLCNYRSHKFECNLVVNICVYDFFSLLWVEIKYDGCNKEQVRLVSTCFK